jgi:hypothetical protein
MSFKRISKLLKGDTLVRSAEPDYSCIDVQWRRKAPIG